MTPSESIFDNRKMYKTRFFYSSNSVPAEIEALLARKSQNCTAMAQKPVSSHVFTSNILAGQCKMSQRSATPPALQATVARNDLSQPIVHPSEEVCVDVSPNAVKNSDSPTQKHISGRSFSFESTGHGFESYENGVPESFDSVVPGKECSFGHSVQPHVFTPTPDLAETEVVGKIDVITDVQNTANVVGHGFESHCSTGTSVTSGPTSVTDVHKPHVTPSCKKMVHCGKGFDSWADKSIPKVPSVNSGFKIYDQLCPIYDVRNMAMEEKFINTIILPIKVTRVSQWV